MLGLSSPLLSTGFMIQVPKYPWREISQKGCPHYRVYLAHLTEGQDGAESPCCCCWHFPSCVFRGLVYKTAESLASLWSILSKYNLKPRFHQVAPLSFRALPAPSPSRCNGRTLHCGVLPVGPPPTSSCISSCSQAVFRQHDTGFPANKVCFSLEIPSKGCLWHWR